MASHTHNHNAPSNEQIKKDLKKDAENIHKKAAADVEDAKEQGKAKAEDLKKQGKQTVDELKARGEFDAENLKKSGQELYEAASERGQQIYDAAAEKGHEAYEAAKKDFDEFEKEGKTFLSQLWADIQSFSKRVGTVVQKNAQALQETSGQALSRAGVELQNPVVITQLFVTAGGAAAAYLVYLERHRIKSDNNYVVGLHASIITGLVLLDGFLFEKYYPKYDKKSSKPTV
ncbi:uncharacterized protein LODBEIA_P29890 [Lodderomyces beijingensis]|uniref:Mitochondrial outer membrane protein OM14 C-terminal domain-containing protein n=1 Tax=Lodderomyces beijingensis TaxID=1775926 RepID=A0ABP0ZNH9_9ASCO